MMRDDTTDPSPIGVDDAGRPRRRRWRNIVALVVLSFLAGSFTSGAGAVWASHQFPDVPTSNQFHGDIDWLVDNGITNGYADGTFKPTAPVSRQALAAFLHRYHDSVTEVNKTVDPPAGTTFSVSVSCPVGTEAFAGETLTWDAGIALVYSASTTKRNWAATWVSVSGASVNPGALGVLAKCRPG